ACEGSLACSTCHVIVGKANSLFSCNKLIIKCALTKLSRLGCQVIQSQIARWSTLSCSFSHKEFRS
ncbi:hypothetical protein IGI04_031379, partial [Brassica rapa subsp. trilocularis]